jgi:hypothetical protein
MNKALLIVLVLWTHTYALNEVERSTKFLRLYKNTLNEIQKDILLKKELAWEKEIKACTDSNNTKCLSKHYLKIITILKEEYIEEHGLITLNNISKNIKKHYLETMIHQTSKVYYNNKYQKNDVCLGKEHQQITKGTVFLTRFYNKVFTLFQGKHFSDKKYAEFDHTDKYKHQSLIFYILNNFSKKTLEKQIIFGLKMMKKEDRLAIYKSLKKLDEMYLYYLNHTNVTEEGLLRFNEKMNVCNYMTYKGEVNHGHVVVIKLLDKHKASLQLRSVVDYMYTFWNRRDSEGMLEKSEALLAFALNAIESNENKKND